VDEIEMLERYRTIAVVGMSVHPGKSAHGIPEQLIGRGFHVIPVNPYHDEVQGLRCYPTLADVPEPVELVNVFRPGPQTPPFVQQAVDIGAKAVWLQQGITSAESRAIAERAGLDYVEDSCIGVVASIGRVRHDAA
jgi:uncharacterized protein